jgi:hypothetical protein
VVSSSRNGGAAVHKQPGSAATLLLLLLTVLTGAGSPLTLRPKVSALFPTTDEVAAMTRDAGFLGVVAARPGALSGAQVVHAMTARRGLPAEQRQLLDRVLKAASPTAQAYLAAAFAAGHPVAQVAAFAAVIAGQGAHWLNSRLRPVDPADVGTVRFRGNSISQYNDTTCGSTTVMVARALMDPLYALRLTTGGRPGTEEESDGHFRRRLRAEEQRIHDDTDVLWPQRAGTPPWGISDRLNRDSAGLGTRYRWVPTVQGGAAFANRVLRQALAAANHGFPVPILIGDVIPRHYVLLLRGDAWGASFYEPTAGEIVVVDTAELERRDFGELGYPRLEGVILPTGPPVA